MKGRIITVTGPRGTVEKSFKHVKCTLIQGECPDPKNPGKRINYVDIQNYLVGYRNYGQIYTLSSHIKNMFKGVTEGFRYKMHAVKKHFPIDLEVAGKTLLIRRFLGERSVKSIKIIDGVTIKKNEKDNEEIWVEGNDVEKVSMNCLLII